MREADVGAHVGPTRTTLENWIDRWISIGAPGRRRKKIGRRTLERHAELLRVHVKPALSKAKIQAITSTKIDELYVALEAKKIAPRTAHHVFTVLGSCLRTAMRKGLLATNPIERAEKVPAPGEADHGTVLEDDELKTLVNGFKSSVLFPFVAVLSFTGCRRNEALALALGDLNLSNKTLRIERALEETDEYGVTFKTTKTERGKRAIIVDDDLIALLAPSARITCAWSPGCRTELRSTWAWSSCPKTP